MRVRIQSQADAPHLAPPSFEPDDHDRLIRDARTGFLPSLLYDTTWGENISGQDSLRDH
jgi:hypothetical protein